MHQTGFTVLAESWACVLAGTISIANRLFAHELARRLFFHSV
jgi:hypothetical protein